ncbi:Calx-beta domain-containing protein [Actinoplanes sp. NPDC024001]|uniref:Calx-beta domain-containing protein n=1 Tax=Actinoplanes sp. NPDC024001 TaxID=3154598 RepID=UPI0033D7C4DC
MRTALSAAVAGIIGLAPAVLISSPAMAANAVANDVAFTATPLVVTEGGVANLELTWVGTTTGSTPETDLTWNTEPTGSTATAASDYNAVNTTTLTFDPTTKKVTLPVTTLGDSVDEASPETITVNVFDPSGSTSTPIKTATINITDDDPEPSYTFTANRTSIPEDGGTVTVTARLSTASGRTINIPYTTADVTAKAGSDYATASGTLTFTPGDTEESFAVTVTNDNVYEGDTPQTFTITPSAADGVAATASPITVGIVDNDAIPTVGIGVPTTNASSLNEGGTLNFPVTINRASESPITVKYSTTDTATPASGHGGATSGSDYTAVSGQTLTFPAGSTSAQTASVITKNDTPLDELTEDVTVALSDVSGATIDPAASKALGYITDIDSTGPVASLAAASKTVASEGNTGTKKHTFTVTLNQASGKEQKIAWTAVNSSGVSAETGKDFTAGSGTLTFAPGETSKTFEVDILGDLIDEGDGESFTVTLAPGSGATATIATGNASNVVTITDDDAKPTVSLQTSDLKMAEGNGYSAALLQVNLSNPSSQAVDWTVAAATDPGTATDASGVVGTDDYDLLTALSTQTIAAGTTSGYVLVLVKGDSIYERDETARFTVALTNTEADATGGPLTGTISLANDDAAPALKVTSVTANEGDTVALKGTVSNVSALDTLLNVSLGGFASNGNRAAGPADFSPTSFPVQITAGTANGSTVNIGNVSIANDTEAEPAEAIGVGGEGFGGTGSVEGGSITIAASDGGTTTPTDPGEEPGEEPGQPTAPTISTPSTTVIGGNTVTLAGKTSANTLVELWGQPMGSTAKGTKLKTVRSDADGNYSVAHWIGQGFVFQTAVGDQWSDEVTIRVRQNPSLVVSSPSKGRMSVTVTGNPKAAGADVTVQSYVSGAWKTVYTGKTGSTGGWVKSVSIASRKSLTLRAMVGGNATTGIVGSGWTVSKRVTIK